MSKIYTDLNTVLTPYATAIKKNASDITSLNVSLGDVKADLSAKVQDLAEDGVYDLLAGGTRGTKTDKGITFTWNQAGTECDINGNYSGSVTPVSAIKGTSTNLLDGIKPNEKYYVTVTASTPNVYFGIYWYKNGSYFTYSTFRTNGILTVPDGVTGMVAFVAAVANNNYTHEKISNVGIYNRNPEFLDNVQAAMYGDTDNVDANHVYLHDDESLGDVLTVEDNDEFLSVVEDANGNLIEAQTKDKKIFFTPVEMLESLYVGPASYKAIDNNEYIFVEQDANENILEALTRNEHRFCMPVRFEKVNWTNDNMTDLAKALAEAGLNTGQMDWSDAKSLEIPEPRCAIINISGSGTWPQTKTADQAEYLEFWDCQGNYFRKPIIFNAQGQSTMAHPKKNGSIDICNDQWIGDDTFKLKIGAWVPQDSFHLKAYYLDFFRGVAVISYQLMNDILLTRGAWQDRPWKKALVDYDAVSAQAPNFGGVSTLNLAVDTGARNFPDGFPCKVYLNGEFYGLYAWQLKKHRDNMHLKKNVDTNVWLDGTVSWDTILGGTINWSGVFEVRNPKDLWLMDGTKYDADNNAGELIDETSEYYDLPTDSSKVKKQKQVTAGVKAVLEDLSQILVDLKTLHNAYAADPTPENKQAIKDKFDTHFDAENLIDYQIVSDCVQNTDGFGRNWQWCTYDGIKWWINMYDVDMSFGAYSATTGVMTPPIEQHVAMSSSVRPNYYIGLLYEDELLERYAYLRRNGVISADIIINKVNDWTNRFGEKYYEDEYDTWPNCAAHGDSVLNDGWELVEGEMGTGNTYNSATTYYAGDTCFYGLFVNNVAMGYYKFEATETVTGVPPVKQWRYNDSIYRLAKWVNTQMSYMDDLYKYTE